MAGSGLYIYNGLVIFIPSRGWRGICSFIADLQKYVYMFYFLRGRGGPPPLMQIIVSYFVNSSQKKCNMLV